MFVSHFSEPFDDAAGKTIVYKGRRIFGCYMPPEKGWIPGVLQIDAVEEDGVTLTSNLADTSDGVDARRVDNIFNRLKKRATSRLWLR